MDEAGLMAPQIIQRCFAANCKTRLVAEESDGKRSRDIIVFPERMSALFSASGILSTQTTNYTGQTLDFLWNLFVECDSISCWVVEEQSVASAVTTAQR